MPPGSVSLPARRIWDQGASVNCCTSCALAASLEALHPDYRALSPVFHYYLSRPGHVGNRGLTEGQALSGAMRFGLCLQSLHPQPIVLSALNVRPSSRATSDGRRRALRRAGRRLYRRLGSSDRVGLWRRALDLGHPLFLVIHLDSSYDALERGGAAEWIPSGSVAAGRMHAVAALGYEDSARRFVVQDSRGPAFGLGGQWYLPYRNCVSNSIEAAYEIRER